jgi:hypothetical protein
MKRILIALVLLSGLLSAIWLAHAAVPARPPEVATQQGGGGSFIPVDVYLDTGAQHLGAYQIELTAKTAMIVGLEGGEAKAFKDAPYYDPAALQGNKIVVASFSTDADLPAGQTRIARLHFMLTGNDAAGMSAAHDFSDLSRKLVVATDADGNSIDAKLSLRAYQGEKQ